MELAAREQGDEGRVHVAGLVGAEEEPVLAAHGLPAQLAFAEVVVERQAAIVEEAAERLALVESVAEPPLDGRLVERARQLLLAPGEEGVDEGLGLLSPRRE